MFPNKALLAETFVVKEKGQWAVYIEVLFDDDVVRYKVGEYFTKQKADIAAKYIRRVANKDLPHPPDALGGCC